jgi:uncharacterized protein YoaH (UPF0181 family)
MMEELSMEEIIKVGRHMFPNITDEQLMQKFEEIRQILPEGMSNAEVAAIIFKSKSDVAQQEQPVEGGRFPGLMKRLRKNT